MSGRSVGAHRAAWELLKGESPGDWHVLHRCDNPPCVNPAHLWLGTNADNMRDASAKGRFWLQKNRGIRRGEGNPNARLTRDLVAAARAYHAAGAGSRLIARLFGVGRKTVQDLLAGRTWQ